MEGISEMTNLYVFYLNILQSEYDDEIKKNDLEQTFILSHPQVVMVALGGVIQITQPRSSTNVLRGEIWH